MINMTREEAITLLKCVSAIEGYLMGVSHEGRFTMLEAYAVPMVDLVTSKLKEEA
jgi:hypothetical protein